MWVLPTLGAKGRVMTATVTRQTYSVLEAATLLRIDRATAYRAIHRGDFPARVIRVMGQWRVVASELDALINGEGSTTPSNEKGES